jgi:hypothetical protein
MSSKEVYDKTSNILAAIDKCGCTHCIALLKMGLKQPLFNNPTDADTTNPEDKSGVSYTDG